MVALKRFLKYFLIFLGIILLLLIGIVVAIQIPSVQNFAKDQAVSYLSDKIKSKVELDYINIGFPNKISLEGLYVQGKDVDTLLYANSLKVGLNMKELLNNKAQITSIDINQLKANVRKDIQGNFNFNYIIDAFATEDDVDKESKPFIISLDKIDLKDISVTYIDDKSAINFDVFLKELDTKVKTFDLNENTYGIDYANVDGLKFKLGQNIIDEVKENVAEKVDSLVDAKPLKLDIGDLNLTNFDIEYDDKKANTLLAANFKKLVVQPETIDLQNQKFIFNKLLLENAEIEAGLFLTKNSSNSETISNQTTTVASPFFSVKEIGFDKVNVHYKNNNGIIGKRESLNFDDIKVSDLNTSIKDLSYNNAEILANINHISFKEQSGLEINKLKGELKYGENETYFENFVLETPNTVLKNNLLLSYNSRNDLSNNLNNVDVKVNLDRSVIGMKDVLKIVPQLKNTSPFNYYPTAKLNINTTVRGTLKKMYIDDLSVSGIDKTSIKASAIVTNVTDTNNLGFDLKLKELKTNASTLIKILPKNILPANIKLPENISLAGTIKGNLKDLNAKLSAVTSYGNIFVDAIFNQKIKGNEKYDVKANLINFNVGKVISNDKIGLVTANATIKGSSLQLDKANATANVQVASANFNSYNYKNIALQGVVTNGNYDVNLNSNDPNVVLNIDAKGNFTKDNATTQINGTIQNLNLKQLNFVEDEMAFKGDINASFSSLNPDYLNGELFVENLTYDNGKENPLSLETIQMYAISNDDANEIQLNSQVVDLNLQGKYKLTQISNSLIQTLNTYYKFTQVKDVSKMNIEPGQYFTVIGAIKNNDIIQRFLPDLKEYKTIDISGNYDNDTRKIGLNFSSPNITYGENTVKDVLLNIENNEEALVMNANIGSFVGKSFSFNEINLGANVENNQLNFELNVLDNKYEPQYYIKGAVDAATEDKRIVLDSETLLLNYESWNVNPENYLVISPKGIYANQINLTNGNSKLEIFSDENVPNSPLNVHLENFEIETITKIVQTESILASGNINGNVKIENLQSQMSFSADASVSNLMLFNNKLGTLTINADNKLDNKIVANASLNGYNNDINVEGFYNVKESAFNFDINLKALQMESLQGFSMNQISNARGYLSGNLNAKGTVDTPVIIGDLNFNNIGFNVVQLNTVFQNMNDKVSFNQEGLRFNNFKISDVENNQLSINGNIATKTYRDFGFNLTVNGKDFKVVNAKESSNALVYGVVALDADLRIRGDLNLPKVDGNLVVTDKTDFTFVMPQSSPALEEREGIIEFVDKSKEANQIKTDEEIVEEVKAVKGLDVGVNITVVDDAKITVVMDKVNGDFVKIQGDAELTGGIDPSGKMTLVGNYVVKEGVYEMSVNVLKRKFIIDEGSTITWTGEPTQADINITAIYKTKAAPLDLVQQQLGDLTSGQLNTYKQQIPFNTHLIIKGEMLKPEISFDILVDEANSSVSSDIISEVKGKLEQLRTSESELNKQVFALLLLNRFIGENPFASSTGFNAESIARQSVSRLLSSQLNNLASELIEGVELDFDLDSSEDFSTGEKINRTDLNIGISKTLLNDRLKISIGSNFGLEGEGRQNENMTNIAGDVNIEYKISKDGKYILRAYRKDKYQVALQGQVIETGVGFIINLDYNEFKELFKRSKKDENKSIPKQVESQPISRKDETN